MADRKGIPYTLQEAIHVANEQRMDEYHREIMKWLIAHQQQADPDDVIAYAAATARVVDQPPPTPTDRRPAWEIVIDHMRIRAERHHRAGAHSAAGVVERIMGDMRERDLIGRERYGVPLTAGNGRNHLVDAYQEELDKTVYLAAFLDEHDVHLDGDIPNIKDDQLAVLEMFYGAISTLLRLRALIERRQGSAPHA